MGRFLLSAFLFASLAGCEVFGVPVGDQSAITYTLYRDSTVEGYTDRIHVATFDAAESEEYNRDNCQLAASLFQEQPGILTRFWCEKGVFRA